MRRSLILCIALAACGAPPRPTHPTPTPTSTSTPTSTPTSTSTTTATPTPTSTTTATPTPTSTSTSTSTPTPPPPPPCAASLSLTRTLPSLKEGTSYMLRREEQTTLAIDDVARAAAASRPWSSGARVPRVEDALARALDPWLGDSEAKYTVRGSAADRLDFTAHGRRIGYALCHGVYEDFDLRGSITLDGQDEIVSLTVAGSASVTEDMCNDDGSARIKTGPYRATYEGHLDRSCSGAAP